ncbi:hypothetical protein, partial [Anaerotignum lactatifermentans]|uniref:hypothetical protein n=1 Tax=Anaerotignum lactatifermentans TaxID=160404 RepID=UPI003AB55A32
TSCLNSGVYRLFGTPFGIKITPLVIQYIILSNKWGAVHNKHQIVFIFIQKKEGHSYEWEKSSLFYQCES